MNDSTAESGQYIEGDTAEVLRWAKPPRSRRWHIFDGTRSLCGSWLRLAGAEDAVESTHEFEEGTDCKTCCKKAGLLDGGDD